MRIRSSLPSIMVLLMFCVLGIATLFLIETVQGRNNRQGFSLEAINNQVTARPLNIQTELENTRTEQSISQAFDLTPLVTRPLVSQTRRMPIIKTEEFPETPVEEAKIEPPIIVELPSPPDIKMLGAFTDTDGIAALVVLETGEEIWVRLETEIDKWIVQSITIQTLTLQLNGESVDINTIE